MQFVILKQIQGKEDCGFVALRSNSKTIQKIYIYMHIDIYTL